MKKIICVFLVLIICVTAFSTLATAAAGEVVFNVSPSGAGVPGDIITVTVTVTPPQSQKIMGAELIFIYDEAVFIPLNITRGNPSWAMDTETYPGLGKIKLLIEALNALIFSEQLLFTIKLEIKDGALPGNYPVTITCNEVYDNNMDDFRYYRVEGSGVTVKPTVITSNTYNVSESYIKNISAKTTVGQFVNNLNEKNFIKVYSGEYQVSNSAYVSTGLTVKLMDGGNTVQSLTAIVTGDVNGDSEVNLADLTIIKRYLANVGSGVVYVEAMDTNKDGNVDSEDVAASKRNLLGI